MIMGLCDKDTQQVRHCDAPIHRSVSVCGCNSRSSESKSVTGASGATPCRTWKLTFIVAYFRTEIRNVY